MDNLWNEIIICLKNQLSGPGFQTFMSCAKPASVTDHTITIDVPNEFSREWIKEHCETLILKHLSQINYSPVVIHYKVNAVDKPSDTEQLSIFKKPDQPNTTHNFNPSYTFKNFVVGHNNRFAYAASEAVSKAPAKAYNPLFIYGSVGLGKTHLLHAISNRILENSSKLKIKLVSSEKFTNELINSIKDKRADAFRSRYRNVDVLLVDDIQFLSGKEQTQEEFFHTFNDLHSNNKQIVLTSDRPPKEIPTLEIRLRTRFEWGLIAD
ncbi:chromosomal replication initiator protein DnaA, partial [Thermoproteota archaeon]